MPDLTVTIPAAAVARVKAAAIKQLNLDPASSDAAVLAALKQNLVDHIRGIVMSAEGTAFRTTADNQVAAIDTSTVAS